MVLSFHFKTSKNGGYMKFLKCLLIYMYYVGCINIHSHTYLHKDHEVVSEQQVLIIHITFILYIYCCMEMCMYTYYTNMEVHLPLFIIIQCDCIDVCQGVGWWVGWVVEQWPYDTHIFSMCKYCTR